MENEILTPIQTVYETDAGLTLPLPEELAELYGELRFPRRAGRPYVVANFVMTLDGVVSLNEPGASGGGEISGFNPHDQVVMGLLRAASDAVIAGASTLRARPGHLWTADFIYPDLAEAYHELRIRLRKPRHPLNVIITAQANLDVSLPLFQSEEAPVMIVTSEAGLQKLRQKGLPAAVVVRTLPGAEWFEANDILAAVEEAAPGERVLVEGGPRMLAGFLQHQLLDELFLALAPQIAGRDQLVSRPGLVAGVRFAPEQPIWGRLLGVKLGGDHLFLRYSFS